MGLYLGSNLKAEISSHLEESLEVVWKVASFTLETLLFLISGGFLGVFFASDRVDILSGNDVWKLILFNFLILLARGLVNLILWPVMNLVGYKLSWKMILVMTYGGLRGAIGLSLALFIATFEFEQDDDIFFGTLTVFYVAGTIAFTVLINGLTIKYLMIGIGFVK